MPGTPLTIFISYKRANRRFVDWLEADLKARGYEVWVDRSKMEGGDDFPQTLQKAIARCDVVLVVLSPQALESKWVRMEYRQALHINKLVIPLVRQRCHEMPLELLGVHQINFQGSSRYHSGLQELLAALRVRSGMHMSADRLPAPPLGDSVDIEFSRSAFRSNPPADHEIFLRVPPTFVGRQREVDWLKAQLSVSNGGIAVIRGEAGIGKTTLAARCVRELIQAGRFTGGVAVIQRYPDDDDAITLLRRVLERFDVQRHAPLEPADQDLRGLREVARALLSKKDVLVVLDGLPPKMDGRPLDRVIELLREAGASLLLTATANLDLHANSIPIGVTLTLKALSVEEAIELFERTFGRALMSGERSAVGHIIELLKRHPLAITHYAANARDSNQPLESLASALGESLAVVELFVETWKDLPKQAQELLTGLAAFATEELGRQAALALGTGLGLPNAAEAVDLLVKRAFVEATRSEHMHAESDCHRLRIHSLVYNFAASQFKAWPHAKQQDAFRVLAQHLAAYVSAIPAACRNDLMADTQNVCGALRWAQDHHQMGVVAALCEGMAPVWHERWRADECENYLPWGIEAARIRHTQSGDVNDFRRETQMAFTYARVLRRTGQMDHAEQWFSRYLTRSRQARDRSSECEILYQLGVLERVRGHLHAADLHLRASLMIARELDLRRHEGIILSQLGRVERIRGNMAEAEQYFQQSLDIAHNERDLRSQGVAFCYLGRIARGRGRFDQAEHFFRTCARIARQNQDVRVRASVLLQRGRIAQARDKLSLADDHFRESLKIALAVRDRQLVGEAYGYLGRLALARHQHVEAERLFRKSLDVAREVQDRRGVGLATCLLGRIAFERRFFDEAQQRFDESLHIAEAVPNRESECVNYYWLAKVAEAHDDPLRAEGLYRKSLAIATEVENGRDIADVLLALGCLLARQAASRDEGCGMLKRALELYRRMGMPRDQASASTALGQSGCESRYAREA
jgi:tetratricopeptide (TPR) repeat protein